MTNCTSAMLVIGDEILSGRTQDKNITYIASMLCEHGIDFCEARVIPDIHDVIVGSVNQLRITYDHVFTSGGIGPTHDDITTDAVAAAFGVEVIEHPEALELIAHQTKKQGLTLNSARRRMARIPLGAKLIRNKISAAPGFSIDNVHVMAGVPSIFREMVNVLLIELPTGSPTYTVTLDIQKPEGSIANKLGKIASKFTSVSIGSYPYYNSGAFGSHVVVRGKVNTDVTSASEAIRTVFKQALNTH